MLVWDKEINETDMISGAYTMFICDKKVSSKLHGEMKEYSKSGAGQIVSGKKLS